MRTRRVAIASEKPPADSRRRPLTPAQEEARRKKKEEAKERKRKREEEKQKAAEREELKKTQGLEDLELEGANRPAPAPTPIGTIFPDHFAELLTACTLINSFRYLS